MNTDYGSLIYGKVQSVKSTLEITEATRLYTKVICVSGTKIVENTINILKLLFFIINLDFNTSQQISTQRKLNQLLTSSIFFVFLTPEMQERLEQTKTYYAFSYFVLKEMKQKPLKRVATKSHFSVCMLLLLLAPMNVFLLYMISGRHCFS